MTRDFLAGLMHVWEILSLAFISFNLRFDLTLKENIHHCSTQILKSTQLLHLHERWNLRVRRSEDTTSLCLGVCAWLLPTAYPDSPPSYNSAVQANTHLASIQLVERERRHRAFTHSTFPYRYCRQYRVQPCQIAHSWSHFIG